MFTLFLEPILQRAPFLRSCACYAMYSYGRTQAMHQEGDILGSAWNFKTLARSESGYIGGSHHAFLVRRVILKSCRFQNASPPSSFCWHLRLHATHLMSFSPLLLWPHQKKFRIRSIYWDEDSGILNMLMMEVKVA